MLTNVTDRGCDYRRANFETAIDRAPQSLGLHHGQLQVIAGFPQMRFILPAAVLALALLYHLQGAVRRQPNPRVSRHAISLPKHECRQAVVIHVVMTAGDIQEPRRLGVVKDIVECRFFRTAVRSAARGMPVCKKANRPTLTRPRWLVDQLPSGPWLRSSHCRPRSRAILLCGVISQEL